MSAPPWLAWLGRVDRPTRFYVVLHVAAAAGFAILVARQAVDREAVLRTDLTVFRTGWELAAAGRGASLYDLGEQRRVQAAVSPVLAAEGRFMPFLHPPHAALALSPLRLVPAQPLYGLWTLLQAAALALLFGRLGDLAGLQAAGDRRIAGAAFAAFAPVYATLFAGQVASFLAVAAAVIAREVGRPRERLWVVAAAALALSIKPHLFAGVVVFLAGAGRWAAALAAAGAAAVAAGAAVAAFGSDVLPAFGRHLAAMGRLCCGHMVLNPDTMPTVRGLLVWLLGGDHMDGINRAALGAFALAAFVAFASGLQGRRRGELPAAFGVALGATLLAAPHLYLYDALLWTVVAAALHGALAGAARARLARCALALPALALAASASPVSLEPIVLVPALAALVAWPLLTARQAAAGPRA